MSIDTTLSRRMTPVKELVPEKTFVTRLLPWVVAGAALVLYFVTRDAWQSMAGTQVVGIFSGWYTDPTRPLYWLVTLPIRVLPEAWIPLTLNVFSAVCGALTLALLVRSVALLPHDRTEAQRVREHSPFAILTIRSSWLPPVLAAAACGLQLTFWEQATGISTEMFDLLIFAYVIRCLLEFRFTGVDSWLLRATLVYAAGMTNNWAMVAFAPLFLTSLIWMKGVTFFNAQFFSRLVFLGSLGLCLYLLMPVVNALSSTSPEGFWSTFKLGLVHQKNYISTFIFSKYILFEGERPLWVLALPSLLPILALSIQWPATFGDHSKTGQQFARFTFNVLHVIFLVLCAWTLLDSKFSPRNYWPALGVPPYNMAMLPFYYLTALSLGYYSGYFLLCFGGAKPVQRLPVTEPPYTPLLNAIVTGGVWLLALGVPFIDLVTNWGQLRQDGPLLRQYAHLKARALPKNAVAMADSVFAWQVDVPLVQVALLEEGRRKECVLLDTRSMTNVAYYRFLAKKHGLTSLPQIPPEASEVSEAEQVKVLETLTAQRPLYYLHPSFGAFFESRYPELSGPILRMVPCAPDSVLQPKLTPELVASHRAFWADVESSQLKPLLTALKQTNVFKSSLALALADNLRLLRGRASPLPLLAVAYSRSLNFTGVQLQRSGGLPDAEARFRSALTLNPGSLSADLNLKCNGNLQAGKDPRVELTPELTEKARSRGNIINTLNLDGPIDEPSGCWDLAAMFFQSANYRQAAEEYNRFAEFRPNDLMSRIALCEIFNIKNSPGQALELLKTIHAKESEFNIDQTNSPTVLRVELMANLLKGDQENAKRLVQDALQKNSADEVVLNVASDAYLRTGYSSNALEMLDQQLKKNANDRGALINLGVAWMRLGNYSNALPPLSRVVAMGTNGSPEHYYTGLYNRAAAYEGTAQLAEAQGDYQQLHSALVAAPAGSPAGRALAWVNYRLGEIGYRRKDTNLAVRHYRAFIDNLVAQNEQTNTPAVSNVLERLKELQPQRSR